MDSARCIKLSELNIYIPQQLGADKTQCRYQSLVYIYMFRFLNENVRGLQMSAHEHVISIDFSASG